MAGKIVMIFGEQFKYYDHLIHGFEKIGFKAEKANVAKDDYEGIIRVAKGYDVVLSGTERWNDITINGVKDTVKLILRFGTGYDNVDLDEATKAGIAVVNTPGKNAVAVAEVAVAFMLNLARKVNIFDKYLKQGNWIYHETCEFSEKTVGLIGFGFIAREVAKILKGFSCDTIVYDVYKDEKAAGKLGARYVQLDYLIKNSDFISMHVPLTKQTRHMVDKDFLQKMKPTSYVVNTSRGGVINQNDLIYALENNIIAGAGLDVFEKEPLPCEHPFMNLDNIIINPHSSSCSYEANINTVKTCIQIVKEFFVGKDPENLLNPEYKKYSGYRRSAHSFV